MVKPENTVLSNRRFIGLFGISPKLCSWYFHQFMLNTIVIQIMQILWVVYFFTSPSYESLCHCDIIAWCMACHLPGLPTPFTWQYSVRKHNIQVIINDVESLGYHVQANSASVSAPLLSPFCFTIFDCQNGISRSPCELFGLFSGFCSTSIRVLSSK